MKNRQCEVAAARAANQVLDETPIRPTVGLVLGTGWGDTVEMADETAFDLGDLPGFGRLDELEGHRRQLCLGRFGGKEVAALRGRIHLNERPADPELYAMVRLQIEMLIKLGVTDLVLTCAAGSLTPDLRVGDICLVDGFIICFAPDMPLFTGEFCSPEDALDPELRQIAGQAAAGLLDVQTGGHVMLRGPQFEGRKYDKLLLATTGAKVVGMSVLPEACVAALYPGVKVLALAFVTNTAIEEHSHESNQQRAKLAAVNLGAFLGKIVGGL